MMVKFEYTISVAEPPTNMKEEIAYLEAWGNEGWEMVSKETIGIRKPVKLITTGREDEMTVYNKFYWKRGKHDGSGTERGQGNTEG